MNNLPIFDLHCDTLHAALLQHKSIIRNNLNLSFERLGEYEKFVQVLAMWSDNRPEENTVWQHFLEADKLLKSELSQADRVKLCLSESDLAAAEQNGDNAVFFAVEGGRLLSDDMSRLDTLYQCGVRFLTLVWDGVCKIGGAHGTDVGLTSFGWDVLERCFTLGIIPDLSHASDKMCDEVLDYCLSSREKPLVCIATHSNARAVRNHPRNLTNERFGKIVRLGGIVGVSLAPSHLTDRLPATVDDVVKHIEHYMEIGGENTVCLGCDLDGIGSMPVGIETVSDITKIAEKLAQNNYTDRLIEKIFYANARNFVKLWLN